VPRGSEFPGRSVACERGRHADCTHQAAVLSFGGAFNRRRLRFEFGSGLCTCNCHGQCPLSGRAYASLRTWSERCTCPGAPGRQHSYQETRAEAISDAKRKRAQRSERLAALDEVRLDARGKSPSEVKRLLEQAFQSRGVDVPPAQTLRVLAGALSRGEDPQHALWAELGGRSRSFLEGLRGAWPQYRPRGRSWTKVAPDRTRPPIDVVLTPEGERWLAADNQYSRRAVKAGGRLDVWLTIVDETGRVEIHVGPRVVGSVSRDEGAEWVDLYVRTVQGPGDIVMTSAEWSMDEASDGD